MAAIESYARLPREERLGRIALTPLELEKTVSGRSAALLSRRPDGKSWAATEVLCHLRDNEESFQLRLQQIMLMDEPRFPTTNPDRWAEERQYLRNDVAPPRSRPSRAAAPRPWPSCAGSAPRTGCGPASTPTHAAAGPSMISSP